MRPDGDEILYVISGTLRVVHDSEEDPADVVAGEAGKKTLNVGRRFTSSSHAHR